MTDNGNRVSLVTGTGRGAGHGIATVLAKEGGKLVICDLDEATLGESAEEARRLGAEVLAVQCDVSDEEQVESMFAKANEAFGRLDVLVNTVAWIDPPGPIAELPTERWHKTIRTNLDSVLFCTRAALRTMIPQESGVIINISSLNGTRGFPERPSYGATKAAVINLTQTTAMENRQYGIRANVLVPGGIMGERVRILREYGLERMKERGEEPPTRSPYPGPPMEMLDPEWIGRYVSWLISPDGRHINGQALVIGEAPRSPLQAMFPDI
ncbi:MAG TPA: SDR family oxidoreductase [Trebonia sp.]|jgi:NAD(P)-dependent dehydrogenase (short-subunit alcohol dehydrogenase family)|nr:SDR family oxidoreductase [Trebonia sp.]